MGEVVQFGAPKQNDTAFTMCACRPSDPVPYVALAIVHETHPIICGLLCPECEALVEVVNGIPLQPAGA